MILFTYSSSGIRYMLMKYDPWELAFSSVLGFTEWSSILRCPSSARYLRDN